MSGPWKSHEEMIEYMLYWQKRALEAEREVEEMIEYMLYWQNRALEAEREVEEVPDDNEDLVELVLEAHGTADYWHQQFLDKDKEIRVALEIVHQQYMAARKELQKHNLPEEDLEEVDHNDPWRYKDVS